jgi:hypothetical protein
MINKEFQSKKKKNEVIKLSAVDQCKQSYQM